MFNGNGVLEWEERWTLVALVMDWTNSGDCANAQRMGSIAHFLNNSEDVLDRTGYREADQGPAVTCGFGDERTPFLMLRLDSSITIYVANETQQNRPTYTEYTASPADRICRFNLEFSLGSKFLKRHGTLSGEEGNKVFKRLKFKEYRDGDYLLQMALQSDRGVERYHERIEDDSWGRPGAFEPSACCGP